MTSKFGNDKLSDLNNSSSNDNEDSNGIKKKGFKSEDIQIKNSYIKIISDGSASSYYEGLLTVVNSLNTVDTYINKEDT